MNVTNILTLNYTWSIGNEERRVSFRKGMIEWLRPLSINMNFGVKFVEEFDDASSCKACMDIIRNEGIFLQDPNDI